MKTFLKQLFCRHKIVIPIWEFGGTKGIVGDHEGHSINLDQVLPTFKFDICAICHKPILKKVKGGNQ